MAKGNVTLFFSSPAVGRVNNRVYFISLFFHFFLTFVQSVFCLAFISFTAVNLDAMTKRMPGLERLCPKPKGFGHCAMLCSSDGGCPEGKKCCFNGCGYDCMSSGKY